MSGCAFFSLELWGNPILPPDFKYATKSPTKSALAKRLEKQLANLSMCLLNATNPRQTNAIRKIEASIRKRHTDKASAGSNSATSNVSSSSYEQSDPSPSCSRHRNTFFKAAPQPSIQQHEAQQQGHNSSNKAPIPSDEAPSSSQEEKQCLIQ